MASQIRNPACGAGISGSEKARDNMKTTILAVDSAVQTVAAAKIVATTVVDMTPLADSPKNISKGAVGGATAGATIGAAAGGPVGAAIGLCIGLGWGTAAGAIKEAVEEK